MANNTENNQKLQDLTEKLVGDLTSLTGTDFTSDSPYNGIIKENLYNNCKNIVAFIDEVEAKMQEQTDFSTAGHRNV